MVQFATLPSKVFSLWQRLGKRFKLEDSPPSGLGARLGTTIIPVTQADALLTTLNTSQVDLDLSAAPGGRVTAFTVPQGKRWIVYQFFLASVTGNSQLLLVGDPKQVRLTSSGTGDHMWSHPIPMNEGWYLAAATTGNGADNNEECSILYSEEDAF
jgi:hypothetical protein